MPEARDGARGNRPAGSTLQGYQMASKQRRSSAKTTKQHGGTLLGVILGLIVGLAIAVVVALYITRSPTPFVAKSQPASGASAASPATATPSAAQPTPPNTAPGQPANPSTGLLDEPKIVEMPATPSAPSAAPAGPTPTQSPTVWGSEPPKPATPATPATPSQPATAQQPATPATPATPGQASSGYMLQVGAYRTSYAAQQQRANLAMLGQEATVSKGVSGSTTYYRVRVGPFSTLDQANKVRHALTSQGFDTTVFRFSPQ